jgi:hypothetical protein
MSRLPEKQKGASIFVNIILIALLGVGGYIGFQYVPQAIESKSIDSILSNLATSQTTDPVNSVAAATEKLTKMLQINEINDMNENFTVKRLSGKIIVEFRYDRELDLIYKKHTMHYEKKISL